MKITTVPEPEDFNSSLDLHRIIPIYRKKERLYKST